LLVEIEVLTAENLAIKSKLEVLRAELEGLHAEREAILQQHAAFVDEIRDLKRRLAKAEGAHAAEAAGRPAPERGAGKQDARISELESELAGARERLAAAEDALRIASSALSRLADCETQLLNIRVAGAVVSTRTRRPDPGRVEAPDNEPKAAESAVCA
jgi:chromosome segregation ATPase